METSGWWEFYKWIAENGNLVLFPIFVIGTLVTLFTGYPSIKNWWAGRSKKSYLKKLQDYKELFLKIESWRFIDTNIFIGRLIYGFVNAFISVILFFLGFLCAFWFYNAKSSSKNGSYELLTILCLSGTYLMGFSTLKEFTKLKNLCLYLGYPAILGERLINFIKTGKEKGFIEKTDNEMLELICNSSLFTDEGKKIYRKLAQLEPKILPETKRQN